MHALGSALKSALSWQAPKIALLLSHFSSIRHLAGSFALLLFAPTSMAACVVLTTSGLTLVNWQLDGGDGDSSLPTRSLCYSMLGPLLASLVQFSQGAEFGHVELGAGVHIAMSTDPSTQVTVAVLFSPSRANDRDLARLKSLVVLRRFVGAFPDDIERIVAAHEEQSRAMADSYTLTQALDGMTSDGDDAHETKSEFLAFERGYVASTMKRTALDCSFEALASTAGSCHAARALLLNAETGIVLDSIDSEADSVGSGRWPSIFSSAYCSRLVTNAALALHESFPLLYHSCLLKRMSCSSRVGFSSLAASSDSSSRVLTLLLRVSAVGDSTAGTRAFVGLRMLSVSVLCFVREHHAWVALL